MTTPPPVSREQKDQAIEAITLRRFTIDDPHREGLSDDPAEVLDYLVKHSRGVPAEVLRADVLDALTLRIWLWWQGERWEAWLLDQADRLEVPRAEVGKRFGIRSSQGVANRIHRKRDLVGIVASPRALPDDAVDRRLASMMPGADPRQHWLDRLRLELDALADAVIGARRLVDADGDDLYQDIGFVATDRRDGVHTPGAFMQLVMAAAQLAVHPPVRALGADDPLRVALARLAFLSTAWDALSK